MPRNERKEKRRNASDFDTWDWEDVPGPEGDGDGGGDGDGEFSVSDVPAGDDERTPEGVEKALSLLLIRNGIPMNAPITQPEVVMTEDTFEEQQELFCRLGERKCACVYVCVC
jgi:hypothetical protein